MSDTKHVNIKAEAANLQNILSDLIGFAKESTTLTPEEQLVYTRALGLASDWLGNITNPYTDEEGRKAVYEEISDISYDDPKSTIDCLFDTYSDAELRDARQRQLDDEAEDARILASL